MWTRVSVIFAGGASFTADTFEQVVVTHRYTVAVTVATRSGLRFEVACHHPVGHNRIGWGLAVSLPNCVAVQVESLLLVWVSLCCNVDLGIGYLPCREPPGRRS